MLKTLYPFEGEIRTVTRDGRYGIVELLEETGGKTRAVINNLTPKTPLLSAPLEIY